MSVKQGGLLGRLIKSHDSKICENCGNLLQVSNNALGCAAHDKLIMPDFPPYHGNMRCGDWKE